MAEPRRELQPGDRVRLRGYSSGGDHVDGIIGTVDSQGHGAIYVNTEMWGCVCVCPSQIKSRLRPKPKREARRVWVNFAELAHQVGIVRADGVKLLDLAPHYDVGWKEFREVLPKRKGGAKA